ncbi:MAG TPA: patatin-like phospholipase family protein [Pseudonocardiaceae bacterium]|jgi:NTE family protein|nr:patatin-like phospholipase family protein [Pseudonocardiaceae bacterium]
MTTQRSSVDLVLEGGGVKGIGLLGAVLVLYEAGYRFERIAGTSAGAIVAALVATYQKAGRDLRELQSAMNSCEYHKFKDATVAGHLTGPLGEGAELMIHEGMHTGKYLYEWLGGLLAETGITTFGQLRLEDPDTSLAPYQRYSLVVNTSDLSRRCLVRLPWDYPQYGAVADDQLIIDAVRASMSFPFFFRPVEFAPAAGGAVTWVDGGLLSNFPITIFDRTDGRVQRWPTWGIKLSGQPVHNDQPVKTSLGIALHSLHTLMGDWNQYGLAEEGVNQRTVFVDTAGISTLDFDLTAEQEGLLFANGKSAAEKFLRQLPPAGVQP